MQNSQASVTFKLIEKKELPFQKKWIETKRNGWWHLERWQQDPFSNLYLVYKNLVYGRPNRFRESYILYKVSLKTGLEWEVPLDGIRVEEYVEKTDHASQTTDYCKTHKCITSANVEDIAVDTSGNVYLYVQYMHVLRQNQTTGSEVLYIYVYYKIDRFGSIRPVAKVEEIVSGKVKARETDSAFIGAHHVMFCDSQNHLNVFYLKGKYANKEPVPNKLLLTLRRYTMDGDLIYQSKGLEIERAYRHGFLATDRIVLDPDGHIYYGFYKYPYRIYKLDKDGNFLSSFTRQVQAEVKTWDEYTEYTDWDREKNLPRLGSKSFFREAPAVIQDMVYSKHHRSLFVFLGVERKPGYNLDIISTDLKDYTKAWVESLSWHQHQQMKCFLDEEGHVCILEGHVKRRKPWLIGKTHWTDYYELQCYETKL